MARYKKLPETMVVDCSEHGFGQFHVLVVPADDATIPNLRYFFLLHDTYCTIHPMFGCGAETDEDAAEMAFHGAPEYIPDFIRECFEEE